MEFRILGPLEVADDGREISIRGRKLQALLALLLLRNGEVVSRDRLIDDLWGDDPPSTAAKTLQVHVSRLRRALGDVVESRGGGYLVRLAPAQLDVERFERLVGEGRRALAERRYERADAQLAEALALWRGPALPELTGEPFAQVELGRLEEARLDAIEAALEAKLALGRHAEAIQELEPLVARHPYRERLRALLMLALYRAGRQADALAAYRDARQALVDELGVEPGTGLRELHGAILAQDPALDGPAGSALTAPRDEPEAPGRPATADRPAAPDRGRARLFAGAAALGVAALIIFVLAAGDDEPAANPLSDDSHAIAVIDPASGRVTRAASVGTSPGPLAFDSRSRSLWVGNLDDRSVTRVNVRPIRTGRTIAVPERPEDLAAGDGAVWVAGAPRTKPFVTARRIDARFDTGSEPVRVESLPEGSASLALDGGALWVAPSAGRLARFDPATGEAAGARLQAGPTPAAIAARAGTVWVADAAGAGSVSRIDARTGIAESTPLAGEPAGIAVGKGAVWVTLALEDAVARIDPATGTVRRTTPVGHGPAGVAVGAGSVWVANSGDGTVTRLDPRTGTVTDTIPVGASPQDVAVADGRVWVSVRPRLPAGEAAPGGTIRMETAEPVDSLDPALAYSLVSFSIMRPTCAKLLDYEAEPGAAGVRPVPELAAAMPRRSNGGRTYTFTVRRGFRFSPPSGEPVTPRSMKYTLERSLDPRMRAPGSDLLDELVGEAAFAAGRARHISGIQASGDDLKITLVEPSRSFLHRIALPFFCAVPFGTPIESEGLRKVPSAGPYYVATHIPDEEVVLRRNPNYGGSRRAEPDEIRIALGVSQTKTVREIEEGTVDYTPIIENPGLARRLRARYGETDAKSREPRYVVTPMLEVDRLIFNTSRPPFSSARLRRAASYALDRTALAREGLHIELPAQPSDQYLSPSMPGFRDARLYPLRPDLSRARRLAGPRRRSVVLYSASFPSHVRFAEIVRMNLRRIGIDVEIKRFGDSYFTRIGRQEEPYDLVMDGWASDYPEATDVLGLLDGRTIREEGNVNLARFDDPVFNRRLDAAANLPSPARELALGRLDVDTARAAAPWAAVANNRRHDFFSARVGCLRYTAAYGVELASLCLRPN